jgi:hypothetical protein
MFAGSTGAGRGWTGGGGGIGNGRVGVGIPLAARAVDAGAPSPRSSSRSSCGVVLALGTSGAVAAVMDVDADVDADVEGEVVVVLDRDDGLTVGLEAGLVYGVVDASANVGESKERARSDNQSSSSVSKSVSVVIAFNVVTPVPGRERVSALCPADGVRVSCGLPAASHSYHSSFNMLEIEETDDDSVCVRVRERLPELVNAGVRPVALVEGRGGLGGGSFVYRPAQFIDREITERNRKTRSE